MLAPFTPLPWKHHEQGDANHYCVLGPNGEWVLAVLHHGGPLPAGQEQNWRYLIHAANHHQELVQALEDLMSATGGCTDHLAKQIGDVLRRAKG